MTNAELVTVANRSAPLGDDIARLVFNVVEGAVSVV